MTKHLPEKSRVIAVEPSAQGSIERVAGNCHECGNCLAECVFLKRHGAPGRLARQYLAGWKGSLPAAYSCSLCGLCTQICTQGLPIAAMFLELRRQAVSNGQGRFKEHLPSLWFEALGNSVLLADYLLPAGCTTVFFPGCALPGIRPRETYRLFCMLQEDMPQLGLVLDCCNKPSHDLGFHDRFQRRFAQKIKKLQEKGVKKVITACPSCLQVFRRYGGKDLKSEIIYTRLIEHEFARSQFNLSYTLHDPCTLRFDSEIHQAVRRLIASIGVSFAEMGHNRTTTFCCGEGGAALGPDGGREMSWRGKRLVEAGGQALLTYCAGCTSALASGRTYHLLDLLLKTPGDEEDAPKNAKAPFTYLNRWYLKLKMKVAFLLKKGRK